MKKTEDQDPLPVIGVITEIDVVSDHQNILVSQAKQGNSTKDIVIHLEDIISVQEFI